MKTIEIMCSAPRAIRAIERLDAAARALWERDCGLVPVVDAAERLVGVVTDRDLCMASYIQGRALAEIPVQTVMARDLVTCRTDEDLVSVMQKMQGAQIHRLPVVDALGHLVGIVSTNDLIRAAHARPAGLDPVAVVRTLATIGAPRAETGALPADASSDATLRLVDDAPSPAADAKPAAARRAAAGNPAGTKTGRAAASAPAPKSASPKSARQVGRKPASEPASKPAKKAVKKSAGGRQAGASKAAKKPRAPRKKS